MFTVKNLSKEYNNEYALNDVSLSINKGMNFIIGASGSGKTTLLRIMSGMEEDYIGEVLVNNANIRELKDKSGLYNNVLGFVWQDFNLLNELSVFENLFVVEQKSEQNIIKVLRELKIENLKNTKVSKLSGGQKQRVAIARELLKNPKIILADEPTSALDKKTSGEIISVLREISKKRPVVIVTHDTSLIKNSDTVFELDKGELVKECEIIENTEILKIQKPKLSLNSAFVLSKNNFKRKPFKFLTISLSVVIASIIILTSLGIQSQGKSSFDDLYDVYGNSFLDISLTGSFMSAAGTAGEEDEPNASVDQDISEIYDIYENDERIEYAVFTQTFKDIVVEFDGNAYSVSFSGNVPVMNELIEGRMPKSDASEVVIPKALAEFIGDENIIGKEIGFNSTIYRWEGNEPIAMPVSAHLTVVGIADNTAFFDNGHSVSIDDSFFVSKSLIDEMRTMANIESDNVSFILRAKTPEDMIAIKDELNAMGIVPLGNFKLVEDMVRLNQNTQDQSNSSNIVLISVASSMVLIATLLLAFMRKRELAILKISGYSKANLLTLLTTENIINLTISVVLTGILIAVGFSSILGMTLVIGFSVVSYLISSVLVLNMNTKNALKTGEK